MFQYMPPRGGQQPTMKTKLRVDYTFQYMPPRGGQQRLTTVFAATKIRVSIHAPTRGATTRNSMQIEIDSKSFNTCPHAGGNNLRFRDGTPSTSGFNTCPHAGGNNGANLELADLMYAFQYMPPRGGQQQLEGWGLTIVKTFQYMPPRGGQQRGLVATTHHWCTRFNTCPHAGGNNLSSLPRPCQTHPFQYMPPRGGQQQEHVSKEDSLQCFNTCPHAGGNNMIPELFHRRRAVSIHAPTRGATTLLR